MALRIVNVFLFLTVLSQAVTGLGNRAIPPATFERVHENGGLLLIALAATHIFLNRRWIRNTYFGKRSSS